MMIWLDKEDRRQGEKDLLEVFSQGSDDIADEFFGKAFSRAFEKDIG